MRLVVASNRLPIVIDRHDGARRIVPGTGGLATALAPILRDRGGLWIGWPGALEGDEPDLEALLADGATQAGYTLKPVMLTQAERDQFYHGFSNEIVWPLFHDLQSRCNFDPSYWSGYGAVNRKFAQVIRENVGRDEFVWVHDYHLMCVGQALREGRWSGRIGFFLHIPFPSLDIYAKLPWRMQLLRAMLAYDAVGFQTERDRRNFMHCVRTLLGDVSTAREGERGIVRVGERRVRAGAYPISIDYQQFAQLADEPEVAERADRLRRDMPCPRIILGLDRLDYTKGIPFRMHAFRNALARYPDLQRQVSLVQVVVPSREDIPMYQNLKAEIEGLVGQINGQYTQSGWVPVHYLYRSLDRPELAAYYRCADVGLITPLKDGMNLVAKEYCACSIDNDSVLILSEFAGAADELGRGALLVNPYDIEGVADAIHRAVTMSDDERRARMRRLRRTIRRHDIFAWVNEFLRESISTEPEHFTPIERQPVAREREAALAWSASLGAAD